MKKFLIVGSLFLTVSVSEGAQVSDGVKVLWDLSHGVSLPVVHPDSMHSRFQEVLREEGITVVLSDTGVLNLDLSQFEGLILAAHTSYNSFYTPEEVSLIETFVAGGGGLLILGDNSSVRPWHLNPVAETFGTTISAVFLPQPDIFNRFISHPIFEGVNELMFFLGSALIAEPPSTEAAWDIEDKVTITVAELGQGRVVVTGDVNVFSNNPPRLDPTRCCINELDNEIFARNVFRWLVRGQTTVDIKPDVLNRKSQGRWITAYIELGGNRDPGDIEVSKTYLTYQDNIVFAELKPTGVGDYDGDGVPDRMVKFDRSAVIEMLREVEVPADVTLTVAGELNDGTPFSGEDIIRIIEPGKKRQPTAVSRHLVSPNPFQNQIQLSYEIETPAQVRIEIYDVAGRLVRSLLQEKQTAGARTVVWDGKNNLGQPVIQGIYFYRIQVNDLTQTEKIILVR